MKLLSVMSLFCLVQGVVEAEEPEISEAILKVCGVTDIESLDAERVEYLSDLIRHPVRINSAGKSQLEATGLFTPYQIASLTDYISRHGGVFSSVELSEVDGFGREVIETIYPFLDFDGAHTGTAGRIYRFRGEANVRGGYKSRTDRSETKSMYGLKSRFSFSDRIVLSFSSTEPYDSTRHWPTLYSGNILWNHSCGKVIVGDFNARFGQGLCMWNTASFSSLTSPSYFMRRPSGLSVTNSFTGSSAFTGLASDFVFNKWKVSAFISLPGIKKVASMPDDLMLAPAFNVSRFGKSGHISLTHSMTFSDVLSQSYRIPTMISSFDASLCICGVNVFCETAYDWVEVRASCLAGCEFRPSENMTMAAQARYLPLSDEHALACAGEYSGRKHVMTFSAEGKYHPEGKSKGNTESYQLKGQFDWKWLPLTCVEVKIKLSERFRTWGVKYLTKFRTDVRYISPKWNATLRLDAVEGVKFACSGYMEAGYTGTSLSAYARLGCYMVDNWDDRIYVYERDAPGNFNVPALYGRGFWTSMYLSWKFAGWGRLYLSGIYKKPGNAELKLQCALHF